MTEFISGFFFFHFKFINIKWWVNQKNMCLTVIHPHNSKRLYSSCIACIQCLRNNTCIHNSISSPSRASFEQQNCMSKSLQSCNNIRAARKGSSPYTTCGPISPQRYSFLVYPAICLFVYSTSEVKDCPGYIHAPTQWPRAFQRLASCCVRACACAFITCCTVHAPMAKLKAWGLCHSKYCLVKLFSGSVAAHPSAFLENKKRARLNN